MRRHRLVPMLALVLLLGACGTSTPAQPRTVTQVVTATGTPPSTSGSAGITVVAPSGSGSGTASSGTGQTSGAGSATSGTATTSGTAKPTTGSTAPTSSSASTSATTSASTGADKKVNPLHVACTSLLDNNDIKKALGASVSSASSRIVDVANSKVKMTGKVKCYYGATSKSKTHPVTVALAQYSSAGAAQTQMDVTASSEVSLGAQSSDVTVSGKKAHVLLRDGGLLVMRYDTWTLSIAVENKVASASKLPDGMAKLATMVLARVLKNG